MIGFLFAVIAGAAMSVQGVMNTRLQENVGLWEANAFVQGTAFVLSLIVLWIFGKGSLRSLTAAPWWNLLGGALGLVKGALLLFFAVWLLRRLQLWITPELISQTYILRFFAEHSPMELITSL